MTDARTSLFCPTCGHVDRPDDTESLDDEPPTCPDCGSGRAYLTTDPARPDAETEAYVKLDPDAAEDA